MPRSDCLLSDALVVNERGELEWRLASKWFFIVKGFKEGKFGHYSLSGGAGGAGCRE